MNGDGASGDRRDSLSVFFPVYNDEATVQRVTEKALRVCGEIADTYEVIIVDDGSPDASGRIADELAASTTPSAWSTIRATGAMAPPCGPAWRRAATNGSASPTATTSTTCGTSRSCGGSGTTTT